MPRRRPLRMVVSRVNRAATDSEAEIDVGTDNPNSTLPNSIHASTQTSDDVPNLNVPDGNDNQNNSGNSNNDNRNQQAGNFKDRCVDELLSRNNVQKLVDILDRSGTLQEWMILIRLLLSGEFKPNNIAFLLLLERVKWQTLKSTTLMRYRKITKRFWYCVYRLCKGKGLGFFSGDKNYGQVITGKTKLGKLNPRRSRINFAVPNAMYLRQFESFMSKVIPPGIVKKTLEMLKGKRDVVLVSDCKKLARGLHADYQGDIDCFGHEEPNLEDFKYALERNIDYVDKVLEEYAHTDDNGKHDLLCRLTKFITQKIRSVREFQVQEKIKLDSFVKKNDPRKYRYAIDAAKTYLYMSTTWVKSALELNQKIVLKLSELQNNHHLTRNNSVILSELGNVRLLHDASEVGKHYDFARFPQFAKQRSDEWFDLRRQSMVTGNIRIILIQNLLPAIC